MNQRFSSNVRRLLWFGTVVLAASLGGQLLAAEASSPNVRIAELEIDPTHIEDYKAALREEIAASIRLESGVVALNAVAEKDHPARIRILEIYASEAAYRAHIKTPHFLKYKVSTEHMVRSLKLIEVVPVLLGSK